MPKPSFDQANTLADPLSVDSYEFLFNKIPGSSIDQSQMSLRCIQAMWGDYGTEKLSLFLPGGHTLHYSGRNQFQGQIQVQYSEDRNMIISQALRTWKEQVRGTTSANSAGYKKDYSVTGQLTIYDTAGATAGQMQFINVWLESVQPLNVDPNGSQNVLIAATFSYDINKDLNIPLL